MYEELEEPDSGFYSEISVTMTNKKGATTGLKSAQAQILPMGIQAAKRRWA
jgi:hypothetical protein